MYNILFLKAPYVAFKNVAVFSFSQFHKKMSGTFLHQLLWGPIIIIIQIISLR